MVGCGSHSVLMVPDGPPGDWGARGGRTSAARQTRASAGTRLGRTARVAIPVRALRRGAIPPGLARRISGDQRAGFGLRPGISRRSPPAARPRGFPTHDSASGRVFCAPPDGPLRRPPQGLPVAHHRLQLPVRLPQHLVPRHFPVFLRTPAPHARQQHDPTANVRSHRLAPLPRRPQPLRLRDALDHRQLVRRAYMMSIVFPGGRGIGSGILRMSVQFALEVLFSGLG